MANRKGVADYDAEGWNAMYRIGEAVVYRRDDGSDFTTTTRSAASVLSGHTAVIWLAGISGCVALHRVRKEAAC
jgi:hypothetical protein